MALNPLHQFEIHTIKPLEIGGYALHFTNQSLWMILGVLSVAFLMLFGMRRKAMVPSRLQAAVEIIYEFIYNTVKENAGHDGVKFLPMVLAVFLFVAGVNTIGLIPGSYTGTSQIMVTASMAAMVFSLVLLVGFYKHGLKFLSIFWPADTPFIMALFVMPLEVISFLARPFTLAVRLAANMVAGHVLVKMVATFIIMLGVLGVIPFAALVMISGLELLVALVQAYVFAVLTCVYINDALHLH